MQPILAAGAVVSRDGSDVVLVHRPKYDDWSFPKGKRDPGEHLTTTAVREVAEETGLDIALGPPLRTQSYPVDDAWARNKDVHYWTGRVVAGDVATYSPTPEIDHVAWVPLAQARTRLTYAHDRRTLAEFEAAPTASRPLVVLRHADAAPREAWAGDDRERTLTGPGADQARRIAPVLAAYGVARVVSSTSRRCRTTVQPYAERAGLALLATDDLSEEDAAPESVSVLVRELLRAAEPVVLCSHRKVLPWVFEALALEPRSLAPGAMLVAHHRAGEVLAVEHHE